MIESFNNRVTGFPLKGGAPHTRAVMLNPGGSGSIRARTPTRVLFATRGGAGLGRSGAVVSATINGIRLAVLLDNIPVPPTLQFDLTIEHAKNSRYGITFTMQPLVQVPKTAVYPDGSGVLLAALQTNSGIGGSNIKVVRVNLAGDTMWTRRLPITLSPVTEAQTEPLVDYRAAPSMFKGVTSVGEKKMIADSLQLEPYWPPIRDVRVARDNTIWITISGPPWQPVRY